MVEDALDEIDCRLGKRHKVVFFHVDSKLKESVTDLSTLLALSTFASPGDNRTLSVPKKSGTQGSLHLALRKRSFQSKLVSICMLLSLQQH